MNTFHDSENFVLAAAPATKLRRSPSEQRMRRSPKHLGERKRSNTRHNSKSESPNKGVKKSSSPRQNRRKQKQSKPFFTRIQQWFIGSFSCVSARSVVLQKETNDKETTSKSCKTTPPCTPQNSQSLHSKISNENIVAINTVDEQLSNQETRSDCPSVSFSYQQMFSDRDTAAAQANKLPSSPSIPLKSILKKPKSDSDVSSSPESSSMTIEGAANNFFSSSDSVTKSMPMSSAANSAHLGHHVAFKRPPPIRTSSSHNMASPTSPTSPILNRTQSQSSVQQPVLLARTLRRVQSDEPHQFTNLSSHAVGTLHPQSPSSPSASSVNTYYSSPSILTLPSTNTYVTLSYNNVHQTHVEDHVSSPTSHQRERTLPRIPSTNSSASFQHRVEQELQRKRSVEEEDFLLAVRLSQEDILHSHHLSNNNSHNNSHNNSFLVSSSPKPLSRSSSSHVSSPKSSFHIQQQNFTPSPSKQAPSGSDCPQVEYKSNLEEEEDEEEDESVFRISSSSSNVKHQANRNFNSEMDDDVALELALRQSLDEDVNNKRLEIREKLALSRALVASLTSTENLTNLKCPMMK